MTPIPKKVKYEWKVEIDSLRSARFFDKANFGSLLIGKYSEVFLRLHHNKTDLKLFRAYLI